MTGQIVTSTAINVSVADYDAVCLDTARGILEGYYGEYYFFQYNADTWCLILYDTDSLSSILGLRAENCTVFNIGKDETVSNYTVQYPFSGSLVSETPGHISGDYSLPRQTVIKNYKITCYTVDSVDIRNPSGYLVYGSANNMPHLIEGVQNYAFTGVFICLCIVCFRLFDRIFRRVY